MKDQNLEKSSQKLPNAENPVQLNNLKLSSIEKVAAGVPAILDSFGDVIGDKATTRGTRALFKMNQHDGFDCPSCAWPDPDDDRSPIGEYCENGAKALAEEATTKKITPEFFKENSVYDLSLLDDFAIGKLGRITEPVYLPENGTHYQRISWDDAFKKIASHLNALQTPDEAAFYTSGRTSNEASFTYQLFVKEFGTNNMPDCSNMCHETSGTALIPTIGIGKGTVRLDDLYISDLIIIIGQNPGTNAPRMMSALSRGKENGAKILAINPVPEAGLLGFTDPQSVKEIMRGGKKLADLYLPVKINGDMALMKALEKLLIDMDLKNPGSILNHDFIKNKTVHFEEYKRQFDGYDLQELAAQCGISVEKLRETADMIAPCKKIVIVWGMGLSQQPNGVDLVHELLNILLLKGSIGIPGGGLCPVRGHSNVQGNRTMLINHKPTDAQLDRLEEVFKFKTPRKHGHDVVDTIKAIHKEEIKVLFSMGGNLLSASPDTHFTAEGMRKLNLSVSVAIKLNRGHLVHGKEAIILPTYARSDKDIVNGELQIITTENAMGVIQDSKGMLDPVSEHLLNENQIICRLAMATLGSRSVIDWMKYHESYDEVRNDIEKCIPGFENYNVRARQKGGFYLPNKARDIQEFSPEHGGKAPFTLTKIPENHLAKDEFLMATTRSHDQFNTTIYGLNDRYRGVKNERRVVFMNKKDIESLGLKKGDLVDLFNYDDGRTRIAHLFVIIEYKIPVRNVMTYFPEANVLLSVHNVVKESNMPAAKYVKIKIKKHEPELLANPSK